MWERAILLSFTPRAPRPLVRRLPMPFLPPFAAEEEDDDDDAEEEDEDDDEAEDEDAGPDDIKLLPAAAASPTEEEDLDDPCRRRDVRFDRPSSSSPPDLDWIGRIFTEGRLLLPTPESLPLASGVPGRDSGSSSVGLSIRWRLSRGAAVRVGDTHEGSGSGAAAKPGFYISFKKLKIGPEKERRKK